MESRFLLCISSLLLPMSFMSNTALQHKSMLSSHCDMQSESELTTMLCRGCTTNDSVQNHTFCLQIKYDWRMNIDSLTCKHCVGTLSLSNTSVYDVLENIVSSIELYQPQCDCWVPQLIKWRTWCSDVLIKVVCVFLSLSPVCLMVTSRTKI